MGNIISLDGVNPTARLGRWVGRLSGLMARWHSE